MQKAKSVDDGRECNEPRGCEDDGLLHEKGGHVPLPGVARKMLTSPERPMKRERKAKSRGRQSRKVASPSERLEASLHSAEKHFHELAKDLRAIVWETDART